VTRRIRTLSRPLLKLFVAVTLAVLLLAPAAESVAAGGFVSGPAATWWVHPVTRAELHRSASARAPDLARMHLFTEDGYPEVDVISGESVDRSGEMWLRVEEPAKPVPIVGWAPATAFTWPVAVRTRLVVDRVHLRAVLYRAGRVIWRAPVGVGKPSTPTPGGRFWVREKFVVAGDGLYGTRAFGTSSHSAVLTDWPNGGVIGIHGTDQPWLIPGRPSHGCIRIRNPDVERLYGLMPVGTPIVVL
jgi:hypothetical protein